LRRAFCGYWPSFCIRRVILSVPFCLL
jgi:hypothetical protein